MYFAAYLHKDVDSAYGVTLPDFPGCFSAADDLADIPRAVQEAIELHFEGEEMVVPTPSAPEQWSGDERFQRGYWMLVDIDMSRLSVRAVRVNISLPAQLVHRIDDFARARHLSRSAFLASAALKEMGAAVLPGVASSQR